jgi:chemotaxis protein MotB
MNVKRLTVTCGALALAAALSTGCTTVQRGAAAGGALGAAAGAVVGNNVAGASTGSSMMIGAGAGAATGGLTGEAFAEVKDSDVKREIENLRAQLRQKEDELVSLRGALASGASDAELAELRDQLKAATDGLAAANSDIDRLRGDLETANASADANSQVRDQLEALRAENTLLNDQIAALRTNAEGLDEQAIAARGRAAELQQRLDDALLQLADANNNLDIVQASLDAKAGQLAALRDELADLNVELEQTSRGLTLTIVDQLLFQPGKADLSATGAQLIGDVSRIISENFPGRELLIEGHTDNVPIKHSGWRSNWELGANRALTVLHEMVGNHGFDPGRVSATTFGEFRPAAPNATAEGRSQNRRSVIVILPEELPIQRNTLASR